MRSITAPFRSIGRAIHCRLKAPSRSEPIFGAILETDSIALVLAFCPHFLALAADLPKPVTAEQIYRQEQATRPPDGIAWSPDGTRFSYIDENGDLLAVEGGTGPRKY